MKNGVAHEHEMTNNVSFAHEVVLGDCQQKRPARFDVRLLIEFNTNKSNVRTFSWHHIFPPPGISSVNRVSYLVEETWIRGDQPAGFGLVEEQNEHKDPLKNQSVHGLVKLGSIGKNPVRLKFRLNLFVVKNSLFFHEKYGLIIFSALYQCLRVHLAQNSEKYLVKEARNGRSVKVRVDGGSLAGDGLETEDKPANVEREE